LAMKINAPFFVVRIWSKRRILLPTWDRTMLPLPFNRIVLLAEGPYALPENMDQEEVFQQFHRFVEDQLLNTAYKCFLMLDKEPDKRLMAKFPDHWQPPASQGRSP